MEHQPDDRIHRASQETSAAGAQPDHLCGHRRDPIELPAGPLLGFFSRHGRSLPWRDPAAGPWGVLVSEIMLQQTPVARVIDTYLSWMRRWPTPAHLAADSPGAAVRAWGRLGYPRRALRLHAAATAITERHAGRVPSELSQLLARCPASGSTRHERWPRSPSAPGCRWSTPTFAGYSTG